MSAVNISQGGLEEKETETETETKRERERERETERAEEYPNFDDRTHRRSQLLAYDWLPLIS
jgi:hypothetical protein